MALPGKTEMARDRAPLEEVLVALERARLALKSFRQTGQVRDTQRLKRSAKAFRDVLRMTRSEAEALKSTWDRTVEGPPSSKMK